MWIGSRRRELAKPRSETLTYFRECAVNNGLAPRYFVSYKFRLRQSRARKQRVADRDRCQHTLGLNTLTEEHAVDQAANMFWQC